jgi:hypothetical protein
MGGGWRIRVVLHLAGGCITDIFDYCIHIHSFACHLCTPNKQKRGHRIMKIDGATKEMLSNQWPHSCSVGLGRRMSLSCCRTARYTHLKQVLLLSHVTSTHLLRHTHIHTQSHLYLHTQTQRYTIPPTHPSIMTPS